MSERIRSSILVVSLAVFVTSCAAVPSQPPDPLASWNNTGPKKAIIAFVERVTTPGSPDFVPAAERVATFDNDGTLWAEQPMYFQLQFALDRVQALAPLHPEWKDTEPFKHVVAGDMDAFLAGGEKALMTAVAVAHSGVTTEEFEKVAKDWIATARHPRTGRPYTQMVFQPMLELLAYLRAHEFKTYIVSGGGVEFMRAFAQQAYGIPPEQVIGSQGVLKFEMLDGKPVLVKMPEVQFVDDREGKARAIQALIGRRPLAAFGNSDGDLEMLQWTAAGPGARLVLLVHHTDAEREWAYDRESHIGKLDKAWDEASAKGWTIVSMKDDWTSIFPK